MRASFPDEPAGLSASPAPEPEREPDSRDDHEPCANCGTPLRDTYCGVCGQRAATRIVPLWQVTNEFLEDLVDLDLRILRTLPTFLFRPGTLTVEYVRGRRRRYIRPLRLYLFSSFLLFTVLALTNLNGFSRSFRPSSEAAQAEMAAARAELAAVRAELGRPFNPTSDSAHQQQVVASVDRGVKMVDEALAALAPPLAASTEAPASAAPSLVGTVDALTDGPVALEPRVLRILDDPGKLVDDLIDRAPYLMFVLVPTFALLLKALYLRRKRLYLEHLIFALHVHALAFIAFAVSTGIGALGWGTAAHLDWWMAVAPFGYLFAALQRVYGQSPGVTAAKAVALLLAYGIILVAAVVLLVLVTVAWM